MMLEHNTRIEISNPTVRCYWINTTDPSVGSSPGFLSDFCRIIGFWEDSDRFCIASRRIRYRIESPGVAKEKQLEEIFGKDFLRGGNF
jgi:hypothetical protein